MRFYVTVQGRTCEVDLGQSTPIVDGVPVPVEMLRIPGSDLRHLLVDGQSIPVLLRPGDRRGAWQLTLDGRRLTVDVEDERSRTIREMSGAGPAAGPAAINAPMPGLVVKVEVEVGQAVKAGQGVVIVEAMKMENELKAPADGVVAQVAVREGQTVEKGALLIAFE